MKHRELKGENRLLRIFLGEGDKVQRKPVYEEILHAAREGGLAGCTALTGLAGFGAGRRIHTPMDQEGAGAFAIILEIIDETNRVGDFWKKIRPILAETGSLVTDEKVTVHHYAPALENQDSDRSEEKMESREIVGENVLLRIFLGESDKSGHETLYLEIIKRAQKLGLAGCTAIRGIAGFGASSVIHESHLLRVSQDLPIVLEAVDTPEKIRNLLMEVRPLLKGALVTEEKVQVHHYQSAKV